MRSPLLTLLTDFGDRDTYVGVMKGVIAGINPNIQVIDLTHQIPPQDIAAARFNLANAYPYFPAHTVHVVVVDPGVGSQRRAIALQTCHGIFVGPDNGVFSQLWENQDILAAVELTQSAYWFTASPSSTFHGRDIFAPVGAHLAAGVKLAKVGQALDISTLKQLDLPTHTVTDMQVTGAIQSIDHFGNLITNIPAHAVQGWLWSAQLGRSQTLLPSVSQYAEGEPNVAIALIGSHNWVEIAINQGNAAAHFRASVGTPVYVNRETPQI